MSLPAGVVLNQEPYRRAVLFFTEGSRDKYYRMSIMEGRHLATQRMYLVADYGRRVGYLGNYVNSSRAHLYGEGPVSFSTRDRLTAEGLTRLEAKFVKGYTEKSHGWPNTGTWHFIRAEFERALKMVVATVPGTTTTGRTYPPWRLPEIVGGQWHRDDFTEEMLAGGYRPLLLGEKDTAEDEYLTGDSGWARLGGLASGNVEAYWTRRRTKRPLPYGVTFVGEAVLPGFREMPLLPAKRRRLLEL
jgi:hypothetical protein